MPLNPLNHHYAMENPASVYDEEAMTALELAGRTTAKVNETVKAFNALETDTTARLGSQDKAIQKMNTETMPKLVKEEYQANIENGAFNRAIDEYSGNLEARLDNLVGLPEGSTAMDAEVIDGRVGADDIQYGTIGTANRSQFNDLLEKHRKTPDVSALAFGYGIDHNSSNLWEQGHFGANGAPGASGVMWYPLCIRVKNYLPATVEFIGCKPGYHAFVERYQTNGTFVDETECEFYGPLNHTSYKYKVALHKCTLSQGTLNHHNTYPSDWENISLCEKGSYHTSQLTNDISNIKALANGYLYGLNHPGLWRQGQLTDDGGQGRVDSAYYNARLNSNYIPREVEAISTETGYWFDLFIYDRTGAFKEVRTALTEFNAFDHGAELYRLALKKTASGLGNTITLEDWHNINLMARPLGVVDNATYNRLVDFGTPPSETYYTPSEVVSRFNKNTKTAQIYSAYDELDAENPGRVAKQVLGYASDGQEVRCYHFKPKTLEGALPGPKFIITTGVHGFEKSSIFGLFYFLQDMCNNWVDNPVLEYLRNNVEFLVIPCANPWGIDNNEYKNANGVNINRNFGEGWKLEGDTTSSQYGGAEAFDQPETVCIRDLLADNLDAFFYIDFHTNGADPVATLDKVNWLALCSNQGGYYDQLGRCAKRHLVTVSEQLNQRYNLELPHDQLTGYLTWGEYPPKAGYADYWGCHVGIMSMTFEGFNGFPGRTAHTLEVHQANASLICSWIMTIINLYKEV